MRLTTLAALVVVSMATALPACTATRRVPFDTVAHVDLPRYMGRWYVISCIPTRIERGAYDAVETYALRADGRIATTFTLRRGSHESPVKAYHPVGRARGASNSIWDMQIIWPFKADYEIAYLDEAYSEVIVARQARDYVWIMARSATLPEERYDRLAQHVAQLGYDTGKLVKVPQRE